jgi:1-acyl-sn-glycerol-3-phosphate acyltransferase
MIRAANYIWRLGATGLAFAALGLGGFFLAWTVIPAATCMTADTRARARRAQGIIRASFRIYVGALRLLGVIRLEVEGADHLARARGALIVANHPTLLDIVLIMALVPRAQCVVKHQLWKHPLLRPVVTATGYIRNDHEAELFIAKCREALAAGENLIIFPEGTRSVPGRPLRFQRGFAHIATLLGVNRRPITITCKPITLVKGRPWYEIPARAPLFRVVVDQSIEVDRFLEHGPRALAARKLVSHLEAYYHGKLSHA